MRSAFWENKIPHWTISQPAAPHTQGRGLVHGGGRGLAHRGAWHRALSEELVATAVQRAGIRRGVKGQGCNDRVQVQGHTHTHTLSHSLHSFHATY